MKAHVGMGNLLDQGDAVFDGVQEVGLEAVEQLDGECDAVRRGTIAGGAQTGDARVPLARTGSTGCATDHETDVVTGPAAACVLHQVNCNYFNAETPGAQRYAENCQAHLVCSNRRAAGNAVGRNTRTFLRPLRLCVDQLPVHLADQLPLHPAASRPRAWDQPFSESSFAL